MSAANGSGVRGNSSNGPARRDLLSRPGTAGPPAPAPAVPDPRRDALAPYLVGRDDESVTLLARAYHERLDGRDRAAAARCAFWIVFILINADRLAIAGGWLARARRLLEPEPAESLVHGYLMLPDAVEHTARGQYARAQEAAGRAAALADRFGDPDLTALARHLEGRASLRQGDIAGGVALLDEAMLGVLTDDVSPVVLTVVYCGLIEGCQEIFDLRRAREWTEALTAWYASRPEVQLNRGRCLVHRAEVHLDNGDWPAALRDAQRACRQLTGPGAQHTLGAAHYVIGELHRLRGSAGAAEQEYRRAGAFGRDPQPGLALLRLAEGDVDAARTAIQRALAETPDRWNRPRLLAAHVEIMLDAGDVPAAEITAAELRDIAEQIDTPYLAAMAAQTSGSVLLANGEAREALALLRRAATTWQDLRVPYEAARCRVLHARGCRELGDDDGGQMQLTAARALFGRLGAAVDVGLTPTVATVARTGVLTGREVQVLRLVAKGMPNRAIAEHLGLREKTIARHLSNIFTKLRVRSRSAATAYAYEHQVL